MITMKVDNEWEFRSLSNGVVECRNEKKGMDWQERNASVIGFLADQVYQIGNAILQTSAMFPRVRQEIPTGAEVAMPQEHDLTQVM